MSSPTTLPVRRRRADMRQELATLVAGHPPFVTVYLDITPGPSRQGAHDRLRQLVGGLDGVTTAQQVVLDREPGATLRSPSALATDATLALMVDADGRRVASTFPHPPGWDVVELGDLPLLGPVLYAEQALVHHVVALFRPDQGTLETVTVPRHGEPAVATYALPDEPSELAPFVQRLCRLSRTTLLIVGAPSRELDPLADTIEAGLGVSTLLARLAIDRLDDEALTTALVHLTADHAARRTVDLLRLWRFHHSQGEAVTGLTATVSALRQGRAALVLLHDEPGDQRRARFGPVPTSLILPGEDHHDSGPFLEARLADVVLRAALLTGCPVHIVPTVPATLDDGMGAILAVRATPASLTELLEV